MGFHVGADGRLEGAGEELGEVSEGGGQESGVGEEDWGGEVRGRGWEGGVGEKFGIGGLGRLV